MPMRSDWIKRFCAKLISIQTVTEAAAIEIAESLYSESSDLSPEEEAENYALEEPPGDAIQREN